MLHCQKRNVYCIKEFAEKITKIPEILSQQAKIITVIISPANIKLG
jgi:hypothetical protein